MSIRGIEKNTRIYHPHLTAKIQGSIPIPQVRSTILMRLLAPVKTPTLGKDATKTCACFLQIYFLRWLGTLRKNMKLLTSIFFKLQKVNLKVGWLGLKTSCRSSSVEKWHQEFDWFRTWDDRQEFRSRALLLGGLLASETSVSNMCKNRKRWKKELTKSWTHCVLKPEVFQKKGLNSQVGAKIYHE